MVVNREDGIPFNTKNSNILIPFPKFRVTKLQAHMWHFAPEPVPWIRWEQHMEGDFNCPFWRRIKSWDIHLLSCLWPEWSVTSKAQWPHHGMNSVFRCNVIVYLVWGPVLWAVLSLLSLSPAFLFWFLFLLSLLLLFLSDFTKLSSWALL